MLICSQAHFSVRLHGTEDNYEPLLCCGGLPACKMTVAHYHCPLCSIHDVYQDPVILRAHFRVKHVDKGVEFAGQFTYLCSSACIYIILLMCQSHFITIFYIEDNRSQTTPPRQTTRSKTVPESVF